MRIALILLTAMRVAAQTQPLIARVERAPLSLDLRREITASIQLSAYPKAERLLLAQIEREPKSAQLLTLVADIFLADRQPLNSAIAFKKADKLQPLSPEDRFTLAMAYMAMKRGDWARPELAALAALQPGNPVPIYWLARIDYDDAKYEDAAAKLRHAIELDPKYARAYDNLGLNLEALGHLDEAGASYRDAMRLNREQPNPSFWPPLNFGTLALKQGHLEEARAALEEALRLSASSSQAHYRMGILCEQEKRNECAVTELQRASQLDPEYADPWWALARVLRRAGRASDADQALAAFQRVKSTAKKN